MKADAFLPDLVGWNTPAAKIYAELYRIQEQGAVILHCSCSARHGAAPVEVVRRFFLTDKPLELVTEFKSDSGVHHFIYKLTEPLDA